MALRSVSTLLESVGAAVWRADALACAHGAVLSSGHPELDAHLPGAGWPVGALCELLQVQPAQHEWRLLLPVLRQATQTPGANQSVHRQGGRALAQQVLLVGAPHQPFAPALAGQGLDARALLWVQADSLAERLWVAEQALRCAGVAALLLWLHDSAARPEARQVRADHLRRLHLAAQAQAKLLFVMRPASAQDEASPAALRLLLGAPACRTQAGTNGQDGLIVRILKRRGPPLAQTLYLPARHAALATLLAVHGAQHRSASAASNDPGAAVTAPRRDDWAPESADALGCIAAIA